MPKKKTVTVSCFNIRRDVRYQYSYVDIFNYIFDIRCPIDVFGSTAIVLRQLREDIDGLRGILSKFTNFDKNEEWINLDRLDRAKANEVNEIVIPENLRPGMKSFYFFFDEKNHKFYIEIYGDDGSLSVRQVLKYFEGIFKRIDVIERFGYIYVSPLTWVDDIISVVEKLKVSTFDVFIQPPNPDDLPQIEKRFLDRLSSKRAASLRETYVASDSDGLVIDDDLTQLAEIGSRNGYVEISGKDRQTGVRVDYNSAEHPAEKSIKYNPDEATEETAFSRAVESFKKDDIERRRASGVQND